MNIESIRISLVTIQDEWKQSIPRRPEDQHYKGKIVQTLHNMIQQAHFLEHIIAEYEDTLAIENK